MNGKRIAMIGGQDFDSDKLDVFLLALKAKHPHAVIVTGNGRGAEAAVKSSAELLGFTVVVPPLEDRLFGKDALMCQINSIMAGADVIVLVGSPTASRPGRASEIWKRMDGSCTKDSRHRRPLHKIAAAKPKPRKKAAHAPKMNVPAYA